MQMSPGFTSPLVVRECRVRERRSLRSVPILTSPNKRGINVRDTSSSDHVHPDHKMWFQTPWQALYSRGPAQVTSDSS
jgi:hypothetical protein